MPICAHLCVSVRIVRICFLDEAKTIVRNFNLLGLLFSKAVKGYRSYIGHIYSSVVRDDSFDWCICRCVGVRH